MQNAVGIGGWDDANRIVRVAFNFYGVIFTWGDRVVFVRILLLLREAAVVMERGMEGRKEIVIRLGRRHGKKYGNLK